MKHPISFMKRSIPLLALPYLISLGACVPQFDDELASLVQKPQMLAMTLEPPEIEAGDTVEAGFLMADERGRLHPDLALWLRNAPGEIETDPRSGIDEDQQQGFGEGSENDLFVGTPEKYSFTFETFKAIDYTYDEDGFASQTVLLVVPQDTPDESLFSGAPDLETAFTQYAVGLLDGSVPSLINYRTAIVSKRDEKNRNPVITSIRALIDNDDPENGEDIEFTTAQETPLDYTTSPAAANPYIVHARKVALKNGKFRYENELEMIYFEVTAEDPDAESDEELETMLRYQWFSPEYPNGGEFKQTRKQIQEFTLPRFTASDDVPVPEDCPETDHRCQTNLYPVWIVVRDNGGESSLGSTWAEFYVKVVLD